MTRPQAVTFGSCTDCRTRCEARRGVLNSGADVSTQDALATARAGNIASFNSQIPLLNTENTQQQTNNLLGLSSQFLNTVPKDTAATGTSTGQSSGQSNQFGLGSGTSNGTTNSSPSILSDVGGIAGLLSGIPGLSNMLSGMFGAGGGGGTPFTGPSQNFDPDLTYGG